MAEFEAFSRRLHSVAVAMRIADIRASIVALEVAESRGDGERAAFWRIQALRQLNIAVLAMGIDDLERKLLSK